MSSPDKLASVLFPFLLEDSFPQISRTANEAYCFLSCLHWTWKIVCSSPFLFAALHTKDFFSSLFSALFSKQLVYSVFPCMSGFLNLRLVSIAPLRAISIWLHLWSAESKWGRVLQLSSFPCWEGKASNLSMCFTVLPAFAIPSLRPTNIPQFEGEAEISNP